MVLKGALHVHTTCSDGELSIYEVIGAHEAQGYDFIALTDHDFLMKKGCYDRVDSLPTDMIVFAGVELTVFAKGYHHVNRIPGDDEVLHIFNHPDEMGLPLERAIERIHEVGAQVPLDAVEITSKGFYTPEYDTDRIPFPKVATDDSHTRQMIGRAWVEMDAKKRKDSILRAIKSGDFWNCFA
ncbi:MAG: PHP domain-containing protein [Deltaproteobacteria bacterium]|nr:PHP domain-containing protein [Deltaproteobacteria bacterium]